MKIIVGLAIGVLAHGAPAQAQAVPSPSVGVWRGTSSCLVRPSSCNNDVVVYRISRTQATDSVAVDARKVVDGQEVEMGVLGCGVDAQGRQITCSIPNGVWHFTIRGDSLVGELRLPDSTRVRDVRAARSR